VEVGGGLLAASPRLGWVDLVPHATLAPVASVTNLFTVDLGTDLTTVARAGGRVSVAFALSLLMLGGISVGLVRLSGVV
jgi:hypothetical protein